MQIAEESDSGNKLATIWAWSWSQPWSLPLQMDATITGLETILLLPQASPDDDDTVDNTLLLHDTSGCWSLSVRRGAKAIGIETMLSSKLDAKVRSSHTTSGHREVIFEVVQFFRPCNLHLNYSFVHCTHSGDLLLERILNLPKFSSLGLLLKQNTYA